jgi:hypothetical protein
MLISRSQVLVKALDECNFPGAAFQFKKFYLYMSTPRARELGRVEKFVRCGLLKKMADLIKNYFFTNDGKCKLSLLGFKS